MKSSKEAAQEESPVEVPQVKNEAEKPETNSTHDKADADSLYSTLENQIINTFYTTSKYSYNDENKMWITEFNPDNYKRPIKISYDLIDSESGKKILSKGDKLNIVMITFKNNFIIKKTHLKYQKVKEVH